MTMGESEDDDSAETQFISYTGRFAGNVNSDLECIVRYHAVEPTVMTHSKQVSRHHLALKHLTVKV